MNFGLLNPNATHWGTSGGGDCHGGVLAPASKIKACLHLLKVPQQYTFALFLWGVSLLKPIRISFNKQAPSHDCTRLLTKLLSSQPSEFRRILLGVRAFGVQELGLRGFGVLGV